MPTQEEIESAIKQIKAEFERPELAAAIEQMERASSQTGMQSPHPINYRDAEVIYDNLTRLVDRMSSYRWGKSLNQKDAKKLNEFINFLTLVKDQVFTASHSK